MHSSLNEVIEEHRTSEAGRSRRTTRRRGARGDGRSHALSHVIILRSFDTALLWSKLDIAYHTSHRALVFERPYVESAEQSNVSANGGKLESGPCKGGGAHPGRARRREIIIREERVADRSGKVSGSEEV